MSMPSQACYTCEDLPFCDWLLNDCTALKNLGDFDEDEDIEGVPV